MSNVLPLLRLCLLTMLLRPFAGHAEDLLIRQITVISADAQQIQRFQADVLLQHGMIAAIGRPKLPEQPEIKTIDGQGKYLIPGLIDSHVHLANIAGMHWGAQRKQQDLVSAYLRQLPKSYLYHGFTTLIDLNNYKPALLEAVAAAVPAPRILHCGAQLQLLHDFNVAMEELPEAERRQLPYLALSADQDDAAHSHSVHAAVKRVRAQQGRCLKIAYEDETVALPVNWQSPDLPLLTALAQQPDLPLVMHAPSEKGHQLALQAKAQVLAHGLWGWPLQEDSFWSAQLSQTQKQLLAEIAKAGIGYQPTLRTILAEHELLQGKVLADPLLRHVYPPAYLAYLQTPAAQWAQQQILKRPQRWSPQVQQLMADRHLEGRAIFDQVYPLYQQRLTEVLQFLSTHQAHLLLGSDTPAMNLYSNPPGYNGFLELRSWAKAGVPLPLIFRAATYNNARTFALDKLGAIQTGYYADLLILNSDPLTNVEAYNDIETVIRQGVLYPRAALSALAQQN
jgi:imidazolonepropionase-like amidohydrolase